MARPPRVFWPPPRLGIGELLRTEESAAAFETPMFVAALVVVVVVVVEVLEAEAVQGDRNRPVVFRRMTRLLENRQR